MLYQLLFCVVIVNLKFVASELPPYITPCNYKDPNWEQCCLEKAKIALPSVIKGDRKYNIPPLNPLKLPEVTVDAGRELKIKFLKVDVYGIENTEIKKTKINIETMHGEVEVFLPVVHLLGTYEVDGKILFLPITGTGPFNITATGGTFIYTFNYKLTEIDGVEYSDFLDDDKIDLKLTKANFKLDNLFNGDEKLGAHMNKFLNDNWEEVIKELGEPIAKTIAIVAKAIAGNIFHKIPYREMILNE